MLLLALAMGCSAWVYATPQGMENFAAQVETNLNRKVVAEKFGESKESFERNGEILFLDRYFFTLDISIDTDPQFKRANKYQKGTDFRANIYQGAAGNVYIKRYPEGLSAVEVFNMRPVKKCVEITVLPNELVTSGLCRYDDASTKTYSVSKFITEGKHVYEFTYVTSQKFMQESLHYYLPGEMEAKILSMVRKTSNKTITNFFRADFFLHGYDYPKVVEQ